MLKRTLGKSSLEVSALDMGRWAIGGPWTWAQPGREPYPAGWGKTDDDESIRAIHAALDMGVNFFDAAANYGAGHSEIVLGKALKGKRATKIPRVYRVLIVWVFVILYGKSQSTEEMCEFVEFLLREN